MIKGLSKGTWKIFDPAIYFKDLVIPDNWETLEEFVDWYMLIAKMPLLIPFNASVMTSDDAVAMCLFRKNNYQVELYLEFPKTYIRRHSHPRMEVITMALGGGCMTPEHDLGCSMNWGKAETKLLSGEFHGGNKEMLLSDGLAFLAFQKWENIEEMSSASVQWSGELQGPNQAKLIRARKKDAIITEFHADVTRDKS